MRDTYRARLVIIIFLLALLLIISLSLALYFRAQEKSLPLVYLFIYTAIALLAGLGLLVLLVRWLLKPYRRIVEAAQGSPLRASTARSESEFVVETLQALIAGLQAKERELAQLHCLERMRAEKSERFAERLIANIPSGLVTVDSSGMVTLANQHALSILKAVRADVGAGENILQPLSVDYRKLFKSSPRMIEMISDCLNKATHYRREEVELVDEDGAIRHLGLSISPIADTAQHTEGALCLMTDITEVTELRERMKLQENLANLGEMAAGLAHEFKNSLATIHGYIQLLEAQGNFAREDIRAQTLTATLNEVRLLTQLVTDFLNFAKPQRLNLSRVDLRFIIDSCANELRQQLERANIELRINGEFGQVTGDEPLLRRAFANLLRNAIEAIDCQAQQKLIEVRGSVDSGHGQRYAHVYIRDTGSGIPSDQIQKIFIPFFTTKSRGYGIGLAIVQKIVVAHGGDVSVDRSDASGTVFHCRLPLPAPPSTMEKNSYGVN
jgi:PAS domain S-box-containing protein